MPINIITTYGENLWFSVNVRGNISKLLGINSKLELKFETIARLIIIVNTKGYGTHSRCNSYIRSFS